MTEVTGMPDAFDRLLGALHGLPDIASTKPSTVRAVTPMTGSSQVFIVQTYRQRETGDTIFLECVTKDGTVRIAIPPSGTHSRARLAVRQQRRTLRLGRTEARFPDSCGSVGDKKKGERFLPLPYFSAVGASRPGASSS